MMQEKTLPSSTMKGLQDSKFHLLSCFKVAGLILFSLSFVLCLILQAGMSNTSYTSVNLMEIFVGASNESSNPVTQSESDSSKSILRDSSSSSCDHHVSGLITGPAANSNCLSREQHMLHRPASQIIPSSPDLVSALTAYEKRHAECTASLGQNWTETFMRSRNGSSINNPNGCQFLIYIEGGAGLGNRLISLVSAFVFALFTNRVLLVDSSEASGHVAHLLCEPFLKSSWALPQDFPILKLIFDTPDLNKAVNGGFIGVGNALMLNLDHSINWGDQTFFCPETRELIKKVDWVAWTSNQYFVPRLFTFPEFWPQLSTLFPNPSHAFTHLSRYLLLPSNTLWEKIFRIYSSYLSSPGKLVGIQIRRHSVDNTGEFSALALERVMHCLMSHHVLPNTSSNAVSFPNERLLEWMTRKMWPSAGSKRNVNKIGGPDVTAVLVASLQQRYAEELQDLYTNFPTMDGSLVRVHMVSHEGMEWHSYDQAQKAFIEMWLLSLSDSVATSSWSTFGYVAHGLGALRPYIVNLRGDLDPNREDHMHDPAIPNSHCVVGQSPEPCNHYSFLQKTDCRNQSALNPAHQGWVERHLGHCQDEFGGLQLVSNFTTN